MGLLGCEGRIHYGVHGSDDDTATLPDHGFLINEVIDSSASHSDTPAAIPGRVMQVIRSEAHCSWHDQDHMDRGRSSCSGYKKGSRPPTSQ